MTSYSTLSAKSPLLRLPYLSRHTTTGGGITPRSYLTLMFSMIFVMFVLYQLAPVVVVIRANRMLKHTKGNVGRRILHGIRNYENQEISSNAQADNHNSVDSSILFFNRVPKTGSENFVNILQMLAAKNGFSHQRYGNPEPRRLRTRMQERQVRIIQALEKRPLSYDRHVYFVDFRKFGSPNPIYFSMVRDPVDKFESRYYYSRFNGKHMYDKMRKKNVSWVANVTREEYINKKIDDCILQGDPECLLETGKKYDLTIPYFCGQMDECQVLNSRWALETAKRNVELWYPVVGALEKLRNTLVLLEHKMPHYFKGVTQMYDDNLKDVHKNRGKRRAKLSDAARDTLKANLTMEIEFYQWAMRRLNGQIELLSES